MVSQIARFCATTRRLLCVRLLCVYGRLSFGSELHVGLPTLSCVLVGEGEGATSTEGAGTT